MTSDRQFWQFHMSHAFPSEFSVTFGSDKFIMYSYLCEENFWCRPRISYACEWLWLQTAKFIFLFAHHRIRKKGKHPMEGARAATVVVGVTIAAAANLNFVCLLLLFLYFPELLFARNWEPNFIWKKTAKWKQANDICFTAANWNWREGNTQRDRERQKAIAGRILKLICMPGLLAYQLGNQSAVASRDRYFD